MTGSRRPSPHEGSPGVVATARVQRGQQPVAERVDGDQRHEDQHARQDHEGRVDADLPLRFTRIGMTWTGEYGITYTVQPSGGNRLTGLAAFFRNDSAGLDFACVNSSFDLL